MKYGESTFDLLYLLFAIISGCLLLCRAKDKAGKGMGLAALVLGCGDAFHLIPRVLHYFLAGDFTVALGQGKLVTSVTMTVFYLLLYFIWQEYYAVRADKRLTGLVWALVFLRVALCLLPQNGWLTNSSDMTWGVLRNIPFVLLGGVVCCLYFRKRRADRVFAPVWLYILLSFLFYLPVAVGAGRVPLLGMLMLPKTVCYILLIVAFLRAVPGKGPRRKGRGQTPE